jgi:hypothetical protein
MLIKRTVLLKMFRKLFWFSLLMFGSVIAGADTRAKAMPKAFLTIDGMELAPNASIYDFAISPDQSRISKSSNGWAARGSIF